MSILHYSPRSITRQLHRAFTRRALKRPRLNHQAIGFPRKARRALKFGGLAAVATLLFAAQAQAFTATRHDPVKAKVSAHQLIDMSVLALRFVHKGTVTIPPATSIYDTSIGNGVDSAGFADLPLNPGGTDGADVATGTPTSLSSNTTYNSGTRTLTVSPMFGLTATWAGVLAPSTTYRVRLSFNITGSGGNFGFYLRDQNGVNLYVPSSAIPSPAAGDRDVLITTTSTSTDLILLSNTQVAGTVTMVGATPHTGSLPGRRFFVNSATGSDAHNNIEARDPSTPLATIAAAESLIAAGRGDQILVAEGETYSAALPFLGDKSGYNPVYPTVVQTYDPADPLNEAKYGRASGANRPILTPIAWGLGQPSYIAIRGFDFNPSGTGNVANAAFTMQAANSGDPPASYVLVENNIFRSTTITFNEGSAAPGAQNFIFRNNSAYGQWGGAKQQGIFASGMHGLTIEDNVLWHNAWKVDASRDDAIADGGFGGQGYYDHVTYAQYTSSGIVYRRNLIIDGPADAGHLLSDVEITENVVIDTPTIFDIQPETESISIYPDGVNQQISYNVGFGGGDIDSITPRGFCVLAFNGAPGSSTHHNVFAWVDNINGSNRYTYETANLAGGVTHMAYHDNVSYKRSLPGRAFSESTSGGPIVTSYTNNKWDNATDGNGNINVDEVTFTNPYTLDELITAAGYTGADAAARKQALIDYAINNPEAHPGRNLLNLAMAGYDIDHSI